MTEYDLSDILYAWCEWRDLERHSRLKTRIGLLRTEHPDIIKAWEDYKEADQRMSHLIEYYIAFYKGKI